ncbi:hypothetical protein GCM10017764_35400 [Sphingobacterium griseoflavum]|uniref:DUF4372 domain-containing protein n=1 Tax=Sphingobacterium griseoflavum TaxID=1474952 RepID=A0ABQ3I2U1_9SPHI|nr:hypothetical protein GCM10017764_35400 [Sphingobacterium griseoflavum]
MDHRLANKHFANYTQLFKIIAWDHLMCYNVRHNTFSFVGQMQEYDAAANKIVLKSAVIVKKIFLVDDILKAYGPALYR